PCHLVISSSGAASPVTLSPCHLVTLSSEPCHHRWPVLAAQETPAGKSERFGLRCSGCNPGGCPTMAGRPRRFAWVWGWLIALLLVVPCVLRAQPPSSDGEAEKKDPAAGARAGGATESVAN